MAEQIFGDYLGKFRVALDSQFFIERYIETHKVWDPITVALVNYFVQAGDYCVDAGANAGFISLAMAKQAGSKGQIFAFEPNNLTFNRFANNLALNPGLEKTITLEQLGLGEKPGELNVFQAGGFGNAYLAESASEKLSGSTMTAADSRCQIIRLDDYAPLHKLTPRQLKLMKIDVEGMELQVLRGAEQTIAAHHPIILYETLLEYFEPQEILDLEGFLREHDYTILGVTQALKLRATTFPDYGENTVALWNQDIPQYLDALHNAGKYELEILQADAPLLATRVTQLFPSVIIASLEPRLAYFATECNNGIACEIGMTDKLYLEVGFPAEPFLSAWKLNFTNQDLLSFTAAITFAEGVVTVAGHKCGGYLERL